MVFCTRKAKENEEGERIGKTMRMWKKANASQSSEYHPVWQTPWQILKGSDIILSL